MTGSPGDSPASGGRDQPAPADPGHRAATTRPWPASGFDAWWTGRAGAHRPHAGPAAADASTDGDRAHGDPAGGTPAPPPRAGAPAPRGAVDAAPPPRGGRGSRVLPVPNRPTRHPRPTRAPALALLALVLLALLAAFFAWVSVEPFWLAVGHGDRGTATVTRCTGTGPQRRCVASFRPANGRYLVTDVALAGAQTAQRQPGVRLSARMVSAHGRLAYVGPSGGLHLRWIIGLLLVLGCGFTIAWATGAYRLPNPRARMIAASLSVGTPLLIALGLAAATW